MEFKKTKIICTIGPVTNNGLSIKRLIESGMNIARLNFSHGTLLEHKKTIILLRSVSKKMNANISILQDLPGPKIRIGKLDKDSYELKKDDRVILTKENITGNNKKFSCSHKEIIDALKIGDNIINDGRIKLTIIGKEKSELVLKVLNNGEIRSYKGLNAPSKNININAITPNDVEFIKFGIKMDVDFIAASFVKTGNDILKIRKILKPSGKDIHIIAKIERQEAIENIDEILKESDGIMVARGDLGIEIPIERIDLNQKYLVDKARKCSKPSIVATQMLMSMTESPSPTRAEVADITNAIFDGADALMLSDETAAGNFPVEACRTMNNVCLAVEKEINDSLNFRMSETKSKSPDLAVSYALNDLCDNLKIEALVIITRSGISAQNVSSRKINLPIIALTPFIKTSKHLNLTWAAMPYHFPEIIKNKDLTNKILQFIKKKNLVKSGSLVIITKGTPNSSNISTNLIEIQTVN